MVNCLSRSAAIRVIVAWLKFAWNAGNRTESSKREWTTMLYLDFDPSRVFRGVATMCLAAFLFPHRSPGSCRANPRRPLTIITNTLVRVHRAANGDRCCVVGCACGKSRYEDCCWWAGWRIVLAGSGVCPDLHFRLSFLLVS
jgi:hypothetical protein